MVVGTPPAAAISPEEEAELEMALETELEETLQLLIDKESFRSDFLGFDDDVQPPTITKEELKANVEQELRRQAIAEFPESLKDQYREEANERYSLHQVGDRIRVITKNGESFSGRLRDRDRYSVLIDLNRVRFDNMADDSLIRFDPDKAAARVARHVELRTNELNEKRKNYYLRNYEESLREAMNETGYIMHLGKWVPLVDYIEQEMEAYRRKIAADLRPLLRKRIYYQAGYRLYNDVWLTRDQIARREEMAAQANEFPPEFEAELDALNAENAGSVGTSSGDASIGQDELF